MNISMDESSDRLSVYKPEGLPGQCEIVDTPGLFGDKERELDGKQVMYEDLTKRYISEAHLIFTWWMPPTRSKRATATSLNGFYVT